MAKEKKETKIIRPSDFQEKGMKLADESTLCSTHNLVAKKQNEKKETDVKDK